MLKGRGEEEFEKRIKVIGTEWGISPATSYYSGTLDLLLCCALGKMNIFQVKQYCRRFYHVAT